MDGDLAKANNLLEDALRLPNLRHDLSSIYLRLSELLERRNQVGDLDRPIELLSEHGGSVRVTDLSAVALRLANSLETRSGPGDVDRAIILLECNDPMSQALSNRGALFRPLAKLLKKRDALGDGKRSEDLRALAETAESNDKPRRDSASMAEAMPLIRLEEEEEIAPVKGLPEPTFE